MNIINEIGDTPKGQEMLGRTAERAYQRAQRTSGADKQRHEKTEWDAYQTAAGNSRKHLDGSGAHFARGRDAEYDEHWDDGRYPWSKKHKSKNESKNMNKKLIRLTESDLHKIVKESAKRIMKEVALKGKSGKTYSLHGTDPESWAVMSRVRGKNGYFPNTPQHYHACRDEDNWIELDDKAHPNLRSRNNANRINAMMNRIDDKSKDIMAANESKLSRIVKESVNRILKESETDYQTYPHIRDNGTKVIVMAHFIDYTFSFEDKKLGEFDSIEEAKRFVLEIVNNNEYIRDLADEVYSNMDENDETRIDRIILNIYQDYGDRGLYAIGNGISVTPEY